MKKMIVLFILVLLAPSVYAADIIIDDIGQPRSSFWTPATSATAWPPDNPHNLSSTNASAWAQWNFTGAPTSSYDVYMWWPTLGGEGDPSASAVVTHKTGSQTVVIDQSVNGGQWNLIGTWSLVGASSNIRITNGGSGRVIFDAVKLVPITLPVPTLTMNAESVGTAKITWDTQDASACTASGGWDGSKPLDGSQVVSNTGTKQYDLECTGPGGGIQGSVTVTAPSMEPPTLKECENGIDDLDAEDILIDYPADPGCTSATDDDETDPVSPVFECNDGIDNADTEDTLIDMADPGCLSPTDNDESNIIAQCNNGIDDADPEDTLIDMADPGCTGPADNDETNAVALVECNDGIDNADAEDTLIDMSDPGCLSPTDTSEANAAAQCADGIDNADPEDTLIDLADPGCANATDNDETNAVVQCNNGIDDPDPEDTLIDMADPGCTGPLDTSEVNSTSSPPLVGLVPSPHQGSFGTQGRQLALELGADSIRIGWEHGDWAGAIQWAAANGKVVVLMLGYGGACNVETAAGRQCYADRSAGLATQYNPEVKYFEVWNEWDGSFGLPGTYADAPANDFMMYKDLLCRTYTAIKAVRPNALVAGAVTAGNNATWRRGLINNGGLDCMDVYSSHIYIYRQDMPGSVDLNANATTAVNAFLAVAQGIQNDIIAKRPAGMKMIFTEVGKNTPATSAGQQLQAQFLTELYNRKAEKSFVEGFWWYQLRDGGGSTFGLVTADYVKKPAFNAFKLIAD